MESLQAELESMKKENETLRFMLQVTSKKCKMLEGYLKEGSLLEINGTQKRPRTTFDNNKYNNQLPVANKTSQFFVKTDSKDNNNLVSTTTLKRIVFCSNIYVLYILTYRYMDI